MVAFYDLFGSGAEHVTSGAEATTTIIQKFLRDQDKRIELFKNEAYRNFRLALDKKMERLSVQGLQPDKNTCVTIIEEMETDL